METQLDFFAGAEQPQESKGSSGPERPETNVSSAPKRKRKKLRGTPTGERREDCPLCGGSGPCYHCAN